MLTPPHHMRPLRHMAELSMDAVVETGLIQIVLPSRTGVINAVLSLLGKVTGVLGNDWCERFG